MADDLNALSARALVAAYRSGALSPVEVLDASLARLAAVDAVLNASCLVDERLGREMAAASERRWRRGEPLGALDGVPVAVKDSGHVAGWPMRFGSHRLGSAPSLADSPGVARLREAGAVFFCKTNTPEFGWKGVTDSPLTGVTRNPWNPARTPGGSSGGAAVAVATGVAPLATGGDGGGSIRIPAAFTGVYGLKPTFGRVPHHAGPLGSLPVFGGLTRTVADSALMLRVISRPDAGDPFAVPYQDIDFETEAERGVEGLTVAVSPDLGFPIVDADVAAAVAAGAAALARAGADVREVTLDLTALRPVIGIIWRSGLAAAVGSLDDAGRARLDPGLRDLVASAAHLSAAELQGAQDVCRALATRMQAFHRDYDLLLTPAVPIPAFEAGRETPADAAFAEWLDWTPCTWPFNLSRQPAASVPCGLTRDGLPIGLQLVAGAFREDLVLRASRAVERALPQRTLAWPLPG